MIRKILTLLLAFVCGALVEHTAFSTDVGRFATQQVVMAQTKTPVTMVHLYTGADNQTHEDEVPADFSSNVFKMLAVTRAELHRASPGPASKWHPEPHRQYVITLRGHGEIEVAGGKKIQLEPGQIEFIEDVTGKGHTTRVVGPEDRVTLWLPIADQTPAK